MIPGDADSGDGGLIEKVHRALWDGFSARPVDDDDPRLDLDGQIRSLIAAAEPLASPSLVEEVIEQVVARIDGLGPLHEFGIDPEITEIMVNGDGQVWLERAGRLIRTGRSLDPDAVDHLIRRLAASAGRRIDLTHPSVDVRLADGSRLHGIIPPLAVDGPCVTIRRFASRTITLHELAAPPAVELLQRAVRKSQTIIVAGGTSSGKTTLLNALAAGIHEDTRIITIEDAAELRLPGRHIIRLETRNATETIPAIGLRELVRHALRMRPDRLICGEMRGAEALDLIQAMNTGHRGSMSTVHANTASDTLRRIETMMLLGDADLPLAAIREQLASCIDLVVMMDRVDGGHRRVRQIAAVPFEPGDYWSLDTLFDNTSDYDADQGLG